MPAPSHQQSSNHAIRKSQSLGGFQLPNTPKNSNKISTLQTSTVVEETDNDATPVATPILGRKPAKAKLGNLFKWFRSTSESKDNNGQNNAGNCSKPVDQPDNNDIYAKVKKTQALKALERSIFSNGTSVSNIKPASSVDSVCSVGSTASFSYVPIKVRNNYESLKKMFLYMMWKNSLLL